MIRLDLDDLPPRVARLLSDLKAGEQLVLVQGGAVVSRLALGAVETVAPSAAAADEAEVDAEAHMAEVLDHFRLMIEDEP
jgi:antitoxin (DNA-binding transcriptional repressor) of toxin-antitoxin stability system